MKVNLKPSKQFFSQKSDCLLIPLEETKTLPSGLASLDKDLNGILTALYKSKDLPLKKDQSFLLPTPLNNSKRIVFIHCPAELTIKSLRSMVACAYNKLKGLAVKQASWLATPFDNKGLSNEAIITEIGSQHITLSYVYDGTFQKKKTINSLQNISIFVESVNKGAKQACVNAQALGEGLNTAKHLGNLPANICTPSYLASEAQAIAKTHDKLICKILSEAQMKKLGMGSLLSVTAGTDEAAKFIILEYKGAANSQKPTVLVGKGVTFDSGGISLKPGGGMDEMKYDMCGAASVIGTFKSIALASPKANIVGLVAAVENMPSGIATKPGDVVTSMSGQTIEVLNTDAEGRLVLCDALTYAERYKPKAVIDIATLTGACIVALGKHASGLYANDDTLQQALIESGNNSFDRVWPMPLWEEYDQQLKSNFADIANIGGPQAGSVTAACFLARFTKAYHWAHIDIAGPAWLQGANKGATGRPVGLLFNYIMNNA
ncbi:MAG: leucyl aminopeptidase [Sinobacterium sp.]|nr:leucyl aminopeptidase [Sinobacterium sp.]